MPYIVIDGDKMVASELDYQDCVTCLRYCSALEEAEEERNEIEVWDNACFDSLSFLQSVVDKWNNKIMAEALDVDEAFMGCLKDLGIIQDDTVSNPYYGFRFKTGVATPNMYTFDLDENATFSTPIVTAETEEKEEDMLHNKKIDGATMNIMFAGMRRELKEQSEYMIDTLCHEIEDGIDRLTDKLDDEAGDSNEDTKEKLRKVTGLYADFSVALANLVDTYRNHVDGIEEGTL